MTNARCLTEGVDLPAVDCVCFTDPKRSKVDIVQAAGRALRLSKGKKFGYILIPIFIPDGLDFNQAAAEQGFDDVSITVRALATTDKRIVEYLRGISEGKRPKGGSPVDGVTSINSLYKVEAEEFDNAVDNMSSLIEPIMIVFMGLMIGGLMIAMYSPIFNVGALIN